MGEVDAGQLHGQLMVGSRGGNASKHDKKEKKKGNLRLSCK